MQIIIKFRNSSARDAEYYLRRRYNSRAALVRLAKIAILREVSNEAGKELAELTEAGKKE